jgi:hypothetical protein
MTQISPGVVTREIDLSTYVPGTNTTVAGFCGVFKWGPLNDIVTLSNEGELVAKFGKPDQETAASFFTAARFLLYSDALRLVRAAATHSINKAFVVSTESFTTLKGVGFLTGSPRVRPGSVVSWNDGSTVQKAVVTDVVSDTTATLDVSFVDADGLPENITSQNVSISIYEGALNATSEEGTGSDSPGIGTLIKNQQDYESNYSNGSANVGCWAARFPGALGNSLEVSICPSKEAFGGPEHVLSGTCSSSATVVTGTATNFLARLVPGSIVKDTASGQERQVVAVLSNTSFTVDKQFSPALDNSVLYAKWEYADAIGVPPRTSEYATVKGGLNDQLHVVVVDRAGDFTGIPGTVLERFSYLSKAQDSKDEDGTSNYYPIKINRNSKYIWWTDHLPAGTNWGNRAENTTFTHVAKPNTVRLSGGKDVNIGSQVNGARNVGYDLFGDPEEVDVAMLLGGEAPTEVAIHLLGIAESRQDLIALLSPPKDAVVDNPGNEAEDVIAFRNSLQSSSYGVLGANWLYIYDKYRDVFVWVPDNGDQGGIVARSDVNSYPWMSPAGYNRGVLKEVVRLAWNPRKAARDDLYLNNVNFVVSQTGSGPVWMGDKTLLNRPSAFDRINVRRLFIVLRKSIAIVAKSLLHEMNDDTTRTQFRNQVEPYLRTVQARRGLYDFRVVCDSSNNTAEVIDRNEFQADIYLKPTKAVNFITLNFVATRSGVQFNEVIGRL